MFRVYGFRRTNIFLGFAVYVLLLRFLEIDGLKL